MKLPGVRGSRGIDDLQRTFNAAREATPRVDGPGIDWPPRSDPDAPGQEEIPDRSRRRRTLRVIMIVSVALVIVVAGAVSTLYLVTNHYVSSMKRIHDPFVSIPAAQRPPPPVGPAAKDMTFLVGGVDTGPATVSNPRSRTDTVMLVHFIAGGHSAYVISIPRDAWVPVPGHGNGKINWAFSYGGPALAVRTVEQLTGVRIDHVAVIDWNGFRGVTDALGGVTVNVPVTSYDPANQVTWTAGTHHLNGSQALLYVRDGNGLTQGDVVSERRQQYFLRAVFTQLRDEGKLTNPLQTSSVLRALTKAVSVDSTLTNSQITSLALGLRRLDLSTAVFASVPRSGTAVIGGQNVVLLNKAVGAGFWHAFEYDTLPAYMTAHALTRLGSSTP